MTVGTECERLQFCHICGEAGHRQWECPKRDKVGIAILAVLVVYAASVFGHCRFDLRVWQALAWPGMAWHGMA